jgi:hypothetical protein
MGGRLMSSPGFHLAEFVLAVAFIGLFLGTTLKTWGGFFFVQGLVTAAVILFVTYLVLVTMIRRHRDS